MAHQYRIGALPTGPAVALAGWLRSWLALRVERGDLRDGTVADYRDIIERYLIPRLGQLGLAEIRGLDITTNVIRAATSHREQLQKAVTLLSENLNVPTRAESTPTSTTGRIMLAQCAARCGQLSRP